MRRQVGKLMRTCHGPCGGHRAVPPRKSDAFRQQKLPKAKHQNPQAGRTRAREHAFRSQSSTLQTAKTKAFPPDAGKKTLAKGQKKARGRRTSGEQVPRRGGRDQATCERDAVAQPRTCAAASGDTGRRERHQTDDQIFVLSLSPCPLALLHVALGGPMGHHTKGRHSKDKERS